jgi:TRAP-type C4-dicarboxylate transport system substrate-binding protein
MDMNGIGRFFRIAAAAWCAALLALAAWNTAAAEEVTLRAVSAFDQGTRFSRNFERFLEKLNAEGKGVLQARYVGGGGKVMNPFEVGNAVRSGVVDLANVTGAFYTNLMPEADAFKLTKHPIQELRRNGGWAYINTLHNEKLNAYFLARQGDGVPFHVYLTKKIDKPDLTGLKLRVTPVYQAFFTALGATPLRTPPGEVYTALERGVVDGYGWPIQGVLDLGWQEVTKFRVDPGFYNADVNVLVNLDKWNALDPAQQALLNRLGAWLEALSAENPKINADEADKQASAGIQTITFTGEEAARYLKTADQAGWDAVLKVSPEHGAKLKSLLSE